MCGVDDVDGCCDVNVVCGGYDLMVYCDYKECVCCVFDLWFMIVDCW